jgi:hypothetical protein
MNGFCTIYTYGDYETDTPRLDGILCQLRNVAKQTAHAPQNFAAYQTVLQELILPKGTDIRGEADAPTNAFDTVVITSYGYNCPFDVYDWYDVARGFTNEYRVGLLHRRVGWTPPTV